MLYNKLLENIVLPVGDMVTGGGLMHFLRKFRKEVNLSKPELDKLQQQRLKDILEHATSKSLYYQSLKIEVNEDPYLWLAQFPILDKKILRSEQNNLLTRNKDGLIKNASSGSTGFQSIVYWTKKEQATFRAFQMVFWEWAGYKIGQPIVQTGINPNRSFVKTVKDKLFRTIYVQAFSHDENEIVSLLRKLPKKGYSFLGYASSLFVLAKIAEKHQINDINFKTSVSWGDKLFPHYRKKINEVFDSKVYETYGSAEGLMMAAQKDLEHMYIMSPSVFIEIVDDEGNAVKDGELGHVIVTNLHAYAMPLIRYRIGDLAIKMPVEEYPQNRNLNLPILQKVIGRDTDIVKTANGKYLVVHAFTGIFEHIPEISQFRIIQKELAGIEIEFIKGDHFSPEVLEIIQSKILEALDNDSFDINFNEVQSIPSTKSGKPQLIQSFLK